MHGDHGTLAGERPCMHVMDDGFRQFQYRDHFQVAPIEQSRLVCASVPDQCSPFRGDKSAIQVDDVVVVAGRWLECNVVHRLEQYISRVSRRLEG